MNQNPYSAPEFDDAETRKGTVPFWKVTLIGVQFLAAYLVGIFACVAWTDAELSLAGTNLVPGYVLLSGVGLLLWFVAALQGLPALPFESIWVVLMILLPCVAEGIAFTRKDSGLKRLRAMWFGFPIGFVGTLGFYWAAMLSI